MRLQFDVKFQLTTPIINHWHLKKSVGTLSTLKGFQIRYFLAVIKWVNLVNDFGNTLYGYFCHVCIESIVCQPNSFVLLGSTFFSSFLVGGCYLVVAAPSKMQVHKQHKALLLTLPVVIWNIVSKILAPLPNYMMDMNFFVNWTRLNADDL